MRFKLKFLLNSISPKRLESINEIVLFFILIFCLRGIAFPPVVDFTLGALFYPAVFFLVIQRWKKILYVLTRDFSFLLLLGVGLASTTWTVWPGSGSLYVRAAIATALLSAYICASYSPKEQMKVWARVFLVWGFTTFIVALVFPNYSLLVTGLQKVRWQGIFEFKFPLGLAMSFGALLASLGLIESKENRGKLWFCLIGTLTLIVLSDSKTSLAALMLAFLFFPIFLLGKNKSYKLRFFFYLMFFLIAIVSITLVTTNIETIIVDWLGKDLTLTGRIPYWKLMIQEGLKRPWLGYGPGGAFWQTEEAISIAFKKGFPALPPTGRYLAGMHSHNGLIDLFLGYGLVGISAFILNYIILFKRVIQLYLFERRPEFFWMILVLIIITVTNFSEVGSILSSRDLRWILYSTIVFSSAIQLQNLKEYRQQSKSIVQQGFKKLI